MSDIWQYVHTRRHRQQRQRLEAGKKEVVVLKESLEKEEEMHEDEGNPVSDRSYGDDQSTEETGKDEAAEEDTLTSPLGKKERSPGSETAGGWSGLFPIPTKEEQLIPPLPDTPTGAGNA